jgi:hypothetical protein
LQGKIAGRRDKTGANHWRDFDSGRRSRHFFAPGQGIFCAGAGNFLRATGSFSRWAGNRGDIMLVAPVLSGIVPVPSQRQADAGPLDMGSLFVPVQPRLSGIGGMPCQSARFIVCFDPAEVGGDLDPI